MNRKEIEEYFNFYLENQKQFDMTTQYVNISKTYCHSSYSYVYANLLMSICSDFESLVRAYFKKHDDDIMEIGNIIELLMNDEQLKLIFEEKATIGDYVDIKPLEVNKYYNKTTFLWWTNYNKLKHNKYKSIHNANQKNVIYALASLYILNRYVLKSFCIENSDEVDVFEKDTNKFKLKNIKTKVISAGRGLVFINSD